ncbi:hypothetical protein ON010_g2676 [Phytophthora cinnamomi]|nr:hypothetical protein ON010_g2676 [Phytophthora cinnamomi]
MGAFDASSKVSERLKAAFLAADKKKALREEIVHRVEGSNSVLVRVSPGPRCVDVEVELEAAAAASAENGAATRPSDARRSYNSVNYARIMWVGMPASGWVVDGKGRTCMCPL